MTTSPRINPLKAALQGMADRPAPVPEPQAQPGSGRSPSRVGKRNVSAYVNATAAKQLRLLAVERESSTQALVEEALNDLFRKYGKSAIA